MVSINYASREVSCKIVYYGPGLSGKTTNLQYVHKKVPNNTKGKLISLATDADRTLYFDFLPINIGSINGFAAKFQLYTVPGQVYYNATRKLVLRGVDGLVFVADSQPDKMDENIESLNNLKENLAEYGYNLNEIPIVIQYNKQDLPGVSSPEEMQPALNPRGWSEFKASATTGQGVFDTLKCILKLVLEKAKSGGTVPSSAELGQPADTATPATAPPSNVQPQAEATPAPSPRPVQPQAAPKAPAPPVQARRITSSTDDEPRYTQVARAKPGQSSIAAQTTQPDQPDSGGSPVREELSPEQPADLPVPPVPEEPRQVYRPFPGNSAEDEQHMYGQPDEQNITPSEKTPASSEKPVPMTGDYYKPETYMPDSGKLELNKIPAGTPRMEPSMKAEKPKKKKKQKKSFFKRLFGLK